MSITQSMRQSMTIVLLPWVIGAFLIGIPIGMVMPPLLLVLVFSLGALGLLKQGHETPSRRRLIASAIGFTMTTVLYLAVWIVGNVAR